jgi:hypothetical protein
MSALVRPLLLDAGSDDPILVEKLCSVEADVEEEEDEVGDPKMSKSASEDACTEKGVDDDDDDDDDIAAVGGGKS